MTREKLDKVLRDLGFERTRDVYVPPYGEDFRILYSINYYEVEVEENSKEKHFSNKGAEKLMEIVFGIEGSEIRHHVDVYRVVCWRLYIIHVFVGFEEEYFAVSVWDKQELEEIAKLELDGGYIFVGSQKDLSTLLPKLIKELDPVAIEVY